jgi:hypothetical protein
VKDKHGDLNCVDNYRPVTISPVLSKIFELVLLEKFSFNLYTDRLQFGFKKNVGCNTAIFAVRQVLAYFNDRGSNVYIASLDATKAFDRLNHFKLFSTLVQRKLPLCFVSVLINWYSKLYVYVKWEDKLSQPLLVRSGVRQGGILSPTLFNVYVDCIISELRNKKLGCSIKHVYIGCIMYADDLLLISSSVRDLQMMLNTCGSIGNKLGIIFNGTKSNCLMVGPQKLKRPSEMEINGAKVKWVNQIKYLGVNLCEGRKFVVDLSLVRRNFFASVNNVLSSCNYVSDMVKLELLEKHCLPLLMYCVESLCLTSVQVAELNSYWNSVYRRVFNYNRWESVKELILLLGRLDFRHLLYLKSIQFLKKLLHCDCELLSNLCQIACKTEYAHILNRCSVKVVWSKCQIKSAVMQTFNSLVNVN